VKHKKQTQKIFVEMNTIFFL